MGSFARLLPIIFLGTIAVVWALGFTLPESYTITSELEIEASPGRVFRAVGDAEGWQRWFTGPRAEARVEADDRLILVHDEVEHVLELTETSSPSAVGYRHYATGAEGQPVEGRLEIAREGAGSRVRIRERVEVEGSTQRWLIYLFGQTLMTQVLDRELHNLKAVVEDGADRGSENTGSSGTERG